MHFSIWLEPRFRVMEHSKHRLWANASTAIGRYRHQRVKEVLKEFV